MTKFIYYILFFSIPLLATAQEEEDTLVADTIESFQEDPPPMERAERTAPPLVIKPPVYTNRSFAPGYQKKYDSPDFVYKTQAQQKSLWDRFWEWVASLFGKPTHSNKPIDLSWLEILIKILAFVVIGIVVYFIARSIVGKESMWIFGRSRRKISHNESEEAENIHEMDFNQLITETKAAGNYRLALRYYYLWVLKALSRRELIDWNWDKTNTDYLYEIKDTNLRKDFAYLSYVYDHSWYGDFPVDEKAFAKAEKSFKKTLNTL